MTALTRRTLLAATAGAAGLAGLGALGVAAPASAGAGRFDLVRGRRPAARLLWWGEPVARFAAEELARYLRLIGGARLTVAAARLHGTAPKRAISGVCAVPAAAGTAVPTGWLATAESTLDGKVADTLLVDATAARLVLTGVGARATLYAAYELLERLGARFFAPDFAYYQGTAELVPHHDDLGVAAGTAVSSPSFALRRKDVEEGWSINDASLTALLDWMAKQRFGTLVFPYDYQGFGTTRYDDFRSVVAPAAARRGITLEVGGHGYQSFLPRAKYPQYYTSGTNVFDVHVDAAVAQYVDNVVAYLAGRPEIGIFDCWPPDGASWPKAAVQKYGSATNAEVHVVNTLVAALAEAKASVQVERIAYGAGMTPPTDGHAFDPGVLVDFAAYGRSYAVGLDDPSSTANAGALASLRTWRAAHTGDLAIYDYSRRYRWRELGSPLAVLAADAATYAGLQLAGVESYAEAGNWLQFEALHLFTGRSAWDATLSAETFLDEYLPDRFGAGATAMRDYFARTAADPDGLAGAPAQFHTAYAKAREDVATAAKAAPLPAGAALVLGRLADGSALARADIDLAVAQQSKDDGAAATARDEYRRLTERYRFAGVQLECSYVTDHYGHGVARDAIAAEYRAPTWCYLPDWAIDGAAGDTVELRIVGQPVDFRAHTLTWSLDLPGGVTADRASGTMRISGAEQPSSTVRLRLAPGAAGGDRRITLSFDVAGKHYAQASGTVLRIPFASLADAYDNVGATADGTNPDVGGGLDGDGSTLSAQELARVGAAPGDTVRHGGVAFTWPEAAAGRPDNVLANGQTIALSGSAAAVGFLLSGSYASTGLAGTGTVSYTDGSTTELRIGAPDWGIATVPAGADVALTMAYRNLDGSRVNRPARVYFAAAATDPGKTIAAVTLPTISDHATGGTRSLHVFAMGLAT
jgi:hypothetical protein